jgi:dipeptidyl aminopeptidase/acylaminoacyl peptidase
VLISGRYESPDPNVGAGVDVVAQARGFRAPSLILHGVVDGVIPVQVARDLEAALRAQGRDVVAQYYDGAGHNLDGEPTVRDDMENRIVTFLCQHLTCGERR